MTIKFFWNGIKEGNGKLVRCFYSDGELRSFPPGTLTIYARDYGIDGHFGPAMRSAFKVDNGTDTMTDYFETDTVRVVPSHPLYPEVLAALNARNAHNEKRFAKRGL